MKEKLRPHGLSLALFGFLCFQLGLSVVGQRQHNQQQLQHAQPTVTYLEYLASADYLEATMENWESEFLQMFAYVLLTAFCSRRALLNQRTRTNLRPWIATRGNRATGKMLPGRCAGAASFSSFMKTRWRWRCFFCS